MKNKEKFVLADKGIGKNWSNRMPTDYVINVVITGDNADYSKKIAESIRDMLFGMLQGNPDYIDDKIVLSDSISYPSLIEILGSNRENTEIVAICIDPQCQFSHITAVYNKINLAAKFVFDNFAICTNGKVDIRIEMNIPAFSHLTSITFNSDR